MYEPKSYKAFEGLNKDYLSTFVACSVAKVKGYFPIDLRVLLVKTFSWRLNGILASSIFTLNVYSLREIDARCIQVSEYDSTTVLCIQ